MLTESLRILSPLARSGRIARELAGELHEVLTSLNERTRYLLSVTGWDAVHRQQLEAVRKDVVRAAILGQQMVDGAIARPATT